MENHSKCPTLVKKNWTPAKKSSVRQHFYKLQPRKHLFVFFRFWIFLGLTLVKKSQDQKILLSVWPKKIENPEKNRQVFACLSLVKKIKKPKKKTSVRHFAIFLGQTLVKKSQVSDPKILQSVWHLYKKIENPEKNRQVFACLTLVKKIENPSKKGQVSDTLPYFWVRHL